MQGKKKFVMVVVALACLAQPAFAVKPTPEEMGTAKRWTAANLSISAAQVPFSFTYGGKPFSDLIKTCKVKQSSRKLDKFRTERTITYLNPATGLSVRLVAISYSDFPTVEWTLYFKNTGRANTPALANISPLDMRLDSPSSGDFILHHSTGSQTVRTDFRPLETRFRRGDEKVIATAGGRPTNTNMPYFNIEWPGAGVIAVVGWSGQWSAKFSRDTNGDLTVRAGQELTNFVLHPGEEVRSPVIVLQFWEGDWIRSQNIWRRWMVAHNLPRPGGELPPPLSTPCSSHQYWEMLGANEENQKMFIDRYIEEGLKPDYWWMDAGWYVNTGSWTDTGTWEVDTKRFPHGIRAISDHAHSVGVKTILWFEPERVAGGTWLALNHPEWIIGGANGGLLNLGNPEARQWITDHIDKLLIEQGIDLYRQDFNMDPLWYWGANDAPDRKGITEIGHVSGYLAYWDELKRRHPNMLIDSCAGGGRRNDLETLRRAVPLIRSDYIFEPTGQQCHMYGISFWIPYNGTGVRSAGGDETEDYMFRSSMSIHITPCWDLRRPDAPIAFNLAVHQPADIGEVRRLMSQWRRVAPNYYGDYYPLTAYSLRSNVWIAWQFDRPEVGEGLVQAFRRADNSDAKARFKLHGLDPGARYKVTDFDAKSPVTIAGRELMEEGLVVNISDKPGAAVILYERVK